MQQFFSFKFPSKQIGKYHEIITLGPFQQKIDQQLINNK